MSDVLAVLFMAVSPSPSFAFDWVPTDEEMKKYRESWNPPAHGTSFTASADVTRQGQWFARLYVQGEIGSGQSITNQSSKTTALPFSSDAVMPAAILYLWIDQRCDGGFRDLWNLLTQR